jgi:hypothetical protein
MGVKILVEHTHNPCVFSVLKWFQVSDPAESHHWLSGKGCGVSLQYKRKYFSFSKSAVLIEIINRIIIFDV